MKKLTDQQIKTIIRRDWVKIDETELTEQELDYACSDFHHWCRYEPGLDHLFRLRTRSRPFGPNLTRLEEYIQTYRWSLEYTRRRTAPADSRPVRLTGARST